MQTEELPFLFALWRTPGVGPSKFSTLLEQYQSAKNALHAINRNPDWANVEKDLKWLEQPNHHLLTKDMPDYPKQLKEIPASPPLLFVDGDISILKQLQIAMVGSRNPTTNGIDTAFEFSKHFAFHGFVITSGLALGIDAVCHEGAIKGKGKTIAIMGTGIDEIYPKKHQYLAKKIADNGAVITELPTGTKAIAKNFPRRNRIISGLSLGVLVVEASYSSGSLITARLALEQNREVFAIPGSIHSPLSRGCHYLIKQGAKLVETAEDVVEEIYLHCHESIEMTETTRISKPHETTSKQSLIMATPEKTGIKTELLQYMNHESTPIDLLINRSGLTAEQVSSILLHLELEGKVVSAPGGYCKVGVK